MKHLLTIGALIMLVFTACKKDKTGTFLSGRYAEVSPNANLLYLNFISSSVVEKLEYGFILNRDTFQYVINSGQITLTQKNTTSILEFTILNDSSFRIENLYASIPENPKTYMVFKKAR